MLKHGYIIKAPWGKEYKVWKRSSVHTELYFHRVDGRTNTEDKLYEYLTKIGVKLFETTMHKSTLDANFLWTIDIQGSEYALIPYKVEINKWGPVSL